MLPILAGSCFAEFFSTTFRGGCLQTEFQDVMERKPSVSERTDDRRHRATCISHVNATMTVAACQRRCSRLLVSFFSTNTIGIASIGHKVKKTTAAYFTLAEQIVARHQAVGWMDGNATQRWLAEILQKNPRSASCSFKVIP